MLLIQRSLRFLSLPTLLLALGSTARAQSGSALNAVEDAAIRTTIKDLSNQWSTAYLKNDTAILERIWAADFIYVEPSGHRFTKAEGIESLKNAGGRHTVSESSSIDVRVYGAARWPSTSATTRRLAPTRTARRLIEDRGSRMSGCSRAALGSVLVVTLQQSLSSLSEAWFAIASLNEARDKFPRR